MRLDERVIADMIYHTIFSSTGGRARKKNVVGSCV